MSRTSAGDEKKKVVGLGAGNFTTSSTNYNKYLKANVIYIYICIYIYMYIYIYICIYIYIYNVRHPR